MGSHQEADVSFNPTMPTNSTAAKNIRAAVAGSRKTRIPTIVSPDQPSLENPSNIKIRRLPHASPRPADAWNKRLSSTRRRMNRFILFLVC